MIAPRTEIRRRTARGTGSWGGPVAAQRAPRSRCRAWSGTGQATERTVAPSAMMWATGPQPRCDALAGERESRADDVACDADVAGGVDQPLDLDDAARCRWQRRCARPHGEQFALTPVTLRLQVEALRVGLPAQSRAPSQRV